MYFREKIDLAHLKVQLLMLPDTVSTVFAAVDKHEDLADTLNQSKIVKGMLSEVHILLRAYFTFPVTSATFCREVLLFPSLNQDLFEEFNDSAAS